ncbi:MAG: IclR family transcriptional regulator [Sulfitobacter sp.]
MPDDTPLDTHASNIPTNLRLLLALEEMARIGVPVTPTKVNEKLGLPKPTVHRLFHTMEEQGFVQRDIDGKSYSPGRRLRKLSTNVLSSLRVRTVRLTILNNVADTIGETCNIATADRDAMIYLDRVETKWPLRIQLPIGTSVPFHCTASGKMYLSSLNPQHFHKFLDAARLEPKTAQSMTDRETLKSEIEKVRANGYSVDDQEFMDGMVAIAVPILDDQQRFLSTLSVHAPIQRVTVDQLRAHLPLLHASSQKLSELLVRDDMTVPE